MWSDWRLALERAFSAEEEFLPHLRELISHLGQRSSHELSTLLNVEFRSLFYASVACEFLQEAMVERIQHRLPADYERKLLNPMSTDAVFSAYNAIKFIVSAEMKAAVGEETSQEMLRAFDRHLPNVILASNAVRHHHDRGLGRVWDKQFTKRQHIGNFGPSILIKDEKMDDLEFRFSQQSIRSLVASLIEILRR